jgi:hypothetical protein
MTRTIVDARRDLIECQNELDLLRQRSDDELLGWLSQVMRLGARVVRAVRDGRMCVAHAARMCYFPCYVYV